MLFHAAAKYERVKHLAIVGRILEQALRRLTIEHGLTGAGVNGVQDTRSVRIGQPDFGICLCRIVIDQRNDLVRTLAAAEEDHFDFRIANQRVQIIGALAIGRRITPAVRVEILRRLYIQPHFADFRKDFLVRFLLCQMAGRRNANRIARM